MRHIDFQHWKIGLWAAIVAPVSGLLAAIAAIWLLNLGHQNASYLLLFASLPPAVMNFIIAEKYQQEPQKVAAMVLIANMASLVMIPLVLIYLLA